ncbi:hypothetical protein HELRODRAFT_163817 [Helobdella robusta]|uniref:E3 ubiquitin-protein ligase PPP1R11 n=1 Tax=Helobdella robusta TaxID=6412 RepID=T1EUI3_HELRO|nr:hypothetical protein HELRODRAFT_163817 [Helobdella robusta]ESN96720.1 hypothetical protein HELRODRAFT_163817 [Helobdella robusta]
MAEGGKKDDTPSKTVTIVKGKTDKERVVLKLTQSANTNGTERRVQWAETTVDNELMNKKKSKCCCIYTKPRAFGESDSESEDEDDHCTHHCRGHCARDYQHVEAAGGTVIEMEESADNPPPDPNSHQPNPYDPMPEN